VGELAEGYVGVRPGAPASARQLADDINGKRARRYAEIAARNDTDPAAVAALAGKKLVERAPAGQWVRGAQGNWRKN
jgi:uncharacterized protein YdbL (DUF1318 family)